MGLGLKERNGKQTGYYIYHELRNGSKRNGTVNEQTDRTDEVMKWALN